MNLNFVLQCGHLVRDPDLRHAASGTAVCKFTLAVNSGWGERQETCFTDCVAFGKKAEVIQKYCKKGSNLAVQGELKQERWEARDGQKRSKHVITVQDFKFGEKDSKRSTSGRDRSAEPDGPIESGEPDHEPASYPEPEDDLPF